jgi:diacylglycerol kinase family enzyme
MAIERGVSWGDNGPLPPDGVVVGSDAEARSVVTAARRANEPIPTVGLLGGDLCRTLGGRGNLERLHSAEATRATVDVGSVLIDGRMHWFVAHLVAKRHWLHGPLFTAMNAQWLGSWNVAPRAHPGDGRLETFAVTMSLGDRLKARSRLRNGSHLPHPDIVYRRTAATQIDLDPAAPVWLDGERLDRARRLSIRLEPDALQVVV